MKLALLALEEDQYWGPRHQNQNQSLEQVAANSHVWTPGMLGATFDIKPQHSILDIM
jgi:hypothetical protein